MDFNQKDKIIIESLMQDCRITLKELAKRTHLTHPAIIYKINKFKSQNYIGKYDAIVNLNKFKIPVKIIFVSVPQKSQKIFENYCVKNKEIMSAWRHIHKMNYSITAPLTKQEEEKIIKFLKKYRLKYEVNVVKQSKALNFSIFDDVEIPTKELKVSPKKLKLDKNDIKLIELLSDGHARDPILELARKLNSSAEFALYRFRKLNKAGYFFRYTVHPNMEKFHLKYEVIIIKVKDFLFKEVLEVIQKTKRGLMLFEIGKNKYLCTLITKSLEDFEKTLEKIMNEFDERLVSLEIYPVKNWLFLNRLDLEKVLLPTEKK